MDSNSKEDVRHIDTQADDPEVAGNKQVADSDAAGYLDPTIVISEEENVRLRRLVHRRYVVKVLS